MLIGSKAEYLLKKTRAKAKMIEYNIPEIDHITVEKEVEKLFLIAVAAIGNISFNILKRTDENSTLIRDAKMNLEFSSKYFDAYLNTQMDKEADDYYLLLGSIAYYLCDYIGSSKVLISKIDPDKINLNANGLEKSVTVLLQDLFQGYKIYSENKLYRDILNLLISDMKKFYETGYYPDLNKFYYLRNNIYAGQ